MTITGSSSVPPPKVVLVGQGYVGLPVALAAVQAGFDVVGFDRDEWKVDQLVVGRSYIDDSSDTDVAAALATGRFRPSCDEADLAGFDFAVITVPTPLRDGAPDLSFVEAATSVVAGAMKAGCTVVLESTTYPGTTDELVGPILEAGSGLTAGADFHLGYSPERIDPGNRDYSLWNTPKVVSGIDGASLTAVRSFYDQIVEHTVAVSGVREAELTKLLENTFRHVNIALVNEMAIHANWLGVDIWEVIAAASSKPFGFMPFLPGPGVGGHCLPIDPSYLSWKIEQLSGMPSRFIEIANDINKQMPRYVVQRVLLGLNDRERAVKGARVLVLGIAYKRNSSDARETPAAAVIDGFVKLGAHVHVHDPHADRYALDVAVQRVELTAEEVAAADVVVLVTDHDDIDYDLVLEHARYVFDTRHRLQGAVVEHL